MKMQQKQQKSECFKRRPFSMRRLTETTADEEKGAWDAVVVKSARKNKKEEGWVKFGEEK